MNKRMRKFISLLLVFAMMFSIASCSSIENFFDLDRGSQSKHHRKDRDDDDDDDNDRHRRHRDDEDEDEEDDVDEEDEEQYDEVDDVAPADQVTIDASLTYPDHVPTADELHPYHAPGRITGQEASDILDEIELEYLQRSIGNSYVDAVILFDDIESMGITCDEVSWGSFTEEDGESLAYYTETLETLYSIDYESLDDQDRAFYDKIVYDFELNQYMASYSAFGYYSLVFDPLLGPQCEIFFLLDVIQFDTVEDAENYILLLEDIDRYYDEILDYEEQRAAYGFANPASVYENIAGSFDALCEQEDDCFLYESFEARVNAIPGIDAATKADLIARNEAAMHDYVFPEFEECSERMGALASYDGVQQGISSFPGGEAYYTVLFMYYSNSSKSIEETTAQLDAMIDALLAGMNSIAYSGDFSWYDEYMNHDYSMGDTDANLQYLNTAVMPDFPDLPAHSYTLRDVPEALEENFSPAAYLGYHLDRFDSNLIITNQGSVTDTFGVTCAHEGYPGHMFQSVYTRSHCEHPYLYLNDSIGYTEGWATYVENYCFKYFTENDTAGTLIMIENEFNVLLFARMDIGINYEGWSVEDCNAWYSETFGMAGGDFTDVFEIVTNQPCYGVKYGIGFVNTGLIMTQAHQDFPNATDEEIHTAYLNALPLTFEMIAERMYDELSGN